MPTPSAPTTYTERLRAPVSWWLLGLGFTVSVGWAFYVATPVISTVVAVVVTGVIVGGWLFNLGRVEVRVDQQALYAGRAVLPLGNVGPVEALDRTTTRGALGAEADARAFLVTRAYLHEAVRVGVVDETDPTPYWLVSTRDPEALAASLSAAVMSD